MKEPFIGITCDVEMPRRRQKAYDLVIDHRYAEIVKNAGGYPVILPPARRQNVIQRYLDGMDGLIIVGGDDVDPRLYGERPKRGTGKVFKKRLDFEIQLCHGAHRIHRAPGSIGACATPSRVFKGVRLPGHMGAEKCTVLNLEVVEVDADRGLLLLRGAVPGAKGSVVLVREAVKTRG